MGVELFTLSVKITTKAGLTIPPPQKKSKLTTPFMEDL